MPSLLKQLIDFTNTVFEDTKFVPDDLVRLSGKAVLSDFEKYGFALRKHIADKEARHVFVTIQQSAERKAVDEVAKATGVDVDIPKDEVKLEKLQSPTSLSVVSGQDESIRKAYVSLQAAAEKVIVKRLHAVKDLNRIAKSIWIIHTPMIATPCVTDGSPTPKLLAEEIMKDESRKALTLSRASIIRDYLQAGGMLIIAYNKAEREEVYEGSNVVAKGRTREQIAIYEKLRQEYPKQIIDFPIDIKEKQAKLKLPNSNYPLDLIGATYLMEDTSANKFEMTNLGVQANDPRDDATWGVWMQNRIQSVPEVTRRMATVFSFLQNAGLNQVLDEHARKFNIDADEFSPLLSRYMSLEVDVEKGMGCKIQ